MIRKPTFRQSDEIGRRVGLSGQTIRIYWGKGIDVWDDAAVLAHKEECIRANPRLKAKRKPVPIAATDAEDDDESPGTPDYEVSRAKWKAEQARKLKLEADRLEGQLVDVEQVRDDLLRIGHAMRATLGRMESELPPMLYGMEPGAMAKAIRAYVDGMLQNLHEGTQNLYGQPRAAGGK